MQAQSEQQDDRQPTARGRSLRWGRRLGVAAFLFFLIKGLAWLIVPAVLAYLAVR